MRRTLTISLLLAMALLITSCAAGQDENVAWQRIDSDVQVWPDGGLQAGEAQQQHYNSTTRPIANLALSAAAAFVTLILGANIVDIYRRYRDPRPSAALASSYLALQPPGELPPALAAQLAGQPNHDAFMATLLDLANRGYLNVVEHSAERGKQPRIELTDNGAPRDRLPAFERLMLETVFDGETTVELNLRASAIGKQLGAFAKHVRAELELRDLLRPGGQFERQKALSGGFALLSISVFLFISAIIFAERISWWLPVLPAVMAAGGIGFIVAGSTIHGLTVDGADERLRWQAFGNSLRTAQPGSAPDLGFGDLLPFAYAFGAAKRLSHAYGDAAGVPEWYRSSATGGSRDGSVLHDFNRTFIAALDSTACGTG